MHREENDCFAFCVLNTFMMRKTYVMTLFFSSPTNGALSFSQKSSLRRDFQSCPEQLSAPPAAGLHLPVQGGMAVLTEFGLST